MGTKQRECGSGIQAGDQDEKTEPGVIQREVITVVMKVNESIRFIEGKGRHETLSANDFSELSGEEEIGYVLRRDSQTERRRVIEAQGRMLNSVCFCRTGE